MTPPKEGGRRLPRGFIPYNGTQEEEIEVLKMVFRLDGSTTHSRMMHLTLPHFPDSNQHGLMMKQTMTRT